MADSLHMFTVSDATVLVVDDTPQNLKLLDLILGDAGYRVLQAASPSQMRQQLTTVKPDLIVLDIMLPGTDGYDLCAELKASPQTSDIPIIFLSSLDSVANKVKGFTAGGADYITKPFDAAEVVARVAHHIKMARLQQQLAQDKQQLSDKNSELVAAQRRAAALFGMLTRQLQHTELDGKYILVEKIGSGGYGLVFGAISLKTHRPVAVKVFRPVDAAHNEEKRHRFRQEGVSSCRISHPNAVAVLDSGSTASGIDYLVMELLSGHPLTAELKLRQPLPLSRCLKIAIPVCQVLVAAHAAGMVHRDIKPDNIFLHQSPKGEIVKLLDFGIAKLIGKEDLMRTALTRTGVPLGTPMYMSPEQCAGEPIDGRSDVYSLGMVLFEMLCGDPPFPLTDNPFVLIFAHVSKQPPRPRSINPAIPPALESAVLAALTKAPAERPTAPQFLSLLSAAARDILTDAELAALMADGSETH